MLSPRALTLWSILGLAGLSGALYLSGIFAPSLSPGFEDELAKASDEQVEALIAREAKKLNVTALGVYVQEGAKPGQSYTFGRAKPGAISQAASLSKAVGAAVILIVADQKGTGLDEDLREEIASIDVDALEGSDRRVTLRRLLSHTTGASQSGYPGYQRDGDFPSTAEVLTAPPRFFESPLEFDGVDGELRYSGGGYTLAQLWAEDVTGKDFAEIASEVLFAPLGMTNSTFAQPIESDPRGLREIIGADSGFAPLQGVFAPLDNSWHNYPEKAAAGLWTTPEDYGLFAKALLEAANGGTNAIPAAVATEMLTPQAETGWEPEIGPTHYGFGVMLALDDNGEVERISHTGANAGYRAHFMVRPASTEASAKIVVALANTSSAPPLNKAIVQGLLRD